MRATRQRDDELEILDLTDPTQATWDSAFDRRTFEDRYAELAFGLGTVPRRTHVEARWWQRPGALIAAVGLLALVLALAAGPPNASTSSAGRGTAPGIPVLTARTGATLVLISQAGPVTVDPDTGHLRVRPPGSLPTGTIQAALSLETGGAVVVDRTAWMVGGASTHPIRLGEADDLVPAGAGRVALVRYGPAGRAELEVRHEDGRLVVPPRTFEAPGPTTPAQPIAVVGDEVVMGEPGDHFGSRLVVRPLAPGPSPGAAPAPRVVSDAADVVGTGSWGVIWRPSSCGSRCPLWDLGARAPKRVVTRFDAGATVPIRATISPDGRTAVVFLAPRDGRAPYARIVDLRTDRTVDVVLGGSVPGADELAWSPRGARLFFLAGPLVETVDRHGTLRRVPVVPPPAYALLAR